MTQRPPHSTAPGRSPSRTVVAPPAPRLAGDRANASQADLLGLTVSVSVSPSQHLIIEVLRRPVEFTQYLSMRYTDRLVAAGIAPSVGSQGDAFDNALAESVIGLYKTEVIRQRGPWRTLSTSRWARTKSFQVVVFLRSGAGRNDGRDGFLYDRGVDGKRSPVSEDLGTVQRLVAERSTVTIGLSTDVEPIHPLQRGEFHSLES